MTAIIDGEAFRRGRTIDRDRANRAAADLAAVARDRLDSARRCFCETAEPGLAAEDGDRLEHLGGVMTDFIDALEPAFGRLGPARDLSLPSPGGGRRTSRSGWDRDLLIDLLVETFEGVLTSEALGLVSAAARLEALRSAR